MATFLAPPLSKRTHTNPPLHEATEHRSETPMAARPDDDPHDHKLAEVAREASDLGRYAGLGFQFVATLGLFGLLGWWLDSKLSWSPWLLVTGIFLGGALAFTQIVLSVNRASASRRSAADATGKTQAGGTTEFPPKSDDPARRER